MKKQLVITSLAMLIANAGFSQNNVPCFHNGTAINMYTNSWTNTLIGDIKFLKAKEEKKDAQIADFNESIMSGKLPPSKYAFVYKVKEDTVTPYRKNYTVTAKFGDKEYSSYYMYYNDTMCLYRTKGVYPLEMNGEEIGFMIQGVEKIPFNIKVGDKLQTYEDVSMTYPKTMNKIVKESVFKGMESHTVTHLGPFVDSKTGQAGNGFYDRTTTEAVYESIDVKVKETLSMASLTINNVNAQVTRKEDLILNGKTYTAYVIESETWSKTKVDRTYAAEKKSVADNQNRIAAGMQKRSDKQMKRWGMNNDDGYTVIYKDEWFVPELGIVAKVRNYDMYGAIGSDVVIESIN